MHRHVRVAGASVAKANLSAGYQWCENCCVIIFNPTILRLPFLVNAFLLKLVTFESKNGLAHYRHLADS
jgi:hypothetical protein